MFATSFLEQSRRDKILVTPHKRRRSAVWGSGGGDRHKATKERSVGVERRRPTQIDEGAQCEDQGSETNDQKPMI